MLPVRINLTLPIRLPRAEATVCGKYSKKSKDFEPSKSASFSKWNHPFAESTKWKQQLAESTKNSYVVIQSHPAQNILS